jgi:hypothetical protein
VTRHHSCRVSPFGHPRIHARLTAPRGISQPPTSFIGSQCQGIHHAPLNTYTQNNLILGRIRNYIHNRQKPPKREPSSIRCSQPLSTNQTPHPTTKDGATTRLLIRKPRTTGLLSQSPIVCLAVPSPANPATGSTFVVHRAGAHYRADHCSPNRTDPTHVGAGE